MEIIIKKNEKLTEKEYQKLVELHYVVAKLSFPDKDVPQSYSEKRINQLNEFLEKNEAILFLGIEESEIYSFAWCYEHQFYDEKRLFINIIAVSAEKRKQGYGKALIKEIENYAKENNYTSIDVIASLNNETSIKFYDALNFEKERIHYVKKV